MYTKFVSQFHLRFETRTKFYTYSEARYRPMYVPYNFQLNFKLLLKSQTDDLLIKFQREIEKMIQNIF